MAASFFLNIIISNGLQLEELFIESQIIYLFFTPKTPRQPISLSQAASRVSWVCQAASAVGRFIFSPSRLAVSNGSARQLTLTADFSPSRLAVSADRHWQAIRLANQSSFAGVQPYQQFTLAGSQPWSVCWAARLIRLTVR